jgi:hypothetical protein
VRPAKLAGTNKQDLVEQLARQLAASARAVLASRDARAGYVAHPGGNTAGVGGRERLHQLPRSCSKWEMRLPCVTRFRTWVLGRVERLWSQLAPRRSASEIASVAVDAVRSRRELIIENAVLRHQVNVLRRRSKRPKLNLVDRLKLLVGARLLPSWRRAIAIV